MAACLRHHPIRTRVFCQALSVPAVLCAVLLTACSAALEADPIATGSIEQAKGVSALAASGASDWDAVKRTMARSATTGPKDHVPWSNRDTGNTGTISDVIASTDEGRNCRNFSTTLSSIDGVRLYKAEMCREKAGGWEYTRVEPFEATAGKRPKS